MMEDRETWENSKELRQSVEQRLRDWGWHMFGGEPDLDYPNHANFADPPKPDHQRYHPEHGPDDAWSVHHVLSSLAQSSLKNLRNAEVLRMQFVRRDLTQRDKARRLGYKSRRTYSRRVNDAMFWFWRQMAEFEDAGQDWAKRA